jgi:hypothetical protein
MAEVERRAVGRRAVADDMGSLLLLPAEDESCRSRPPAVPSPPLLSAMLGWRVELGVGVLVEGTEKEAEA